MVEHLKELLTDQLALMRAAVQVLDESFSRTPELMETAECVGRYVHAKGYSGESSQAH